MSEEPPLPNGEPIMIPVWSRHGVGRVQGDPQPEPRHEHAVPLPLRLQRSDLRRMHHGRQGRRRLVRLRRYLQRRQQLWMVLGRLRQ